MSLFRALPLRALQLRALRRGMRAGLMVGGIALIALLLPDSGVHPTRFTLVKVDTSQATDLGSLAKGKDVISILAIGSDARPDEETLKARGDAIHMIFLNTRTGAAADIGVPRDSWVEVPGVGSTRINAALYYGGPELMGRAVGNLVGVQPDYVFVTRFWSFVDIVKSIGPIQVDNPVPFSDEYLKPKGFRSGKITLYPYDAFAFSRIRHDLLRGDFDRSANQSRVIAAIQEKVHARRDDPGFLSKGVMSVMENLETNLSPAELWRLAHAVADVDPTKVTGCVVWGDIGNIDGASVVLPYVDDARSYGDQARNDATIEDCLH